jgi:hypothetical protein
VFLAGSREWPILVNVANPSTLQRTTGAGCSLADGRTRWECPSAPLAPGNKTRGLGLVFSFIDRTDKKLCYDKKYTIPTGQCLGF